MNISRILKATCLLLSTLITAAGQDTQITLSAKKGSKYLVALSFVASPKLDPQWAQEHFEKVIQADLRQSGIFEEASAPVAKPSQAPEKPADSTPGPELMLKVSLEKNTKSSYTCLVDVLDARIGQGIYAKSYTGEEIVLRRMAHRVVDDLVGRVTGTRGIAESRILFAKDMGKGIKELFQVDRDGHSPRQLTRIGSLTITPSVAPDGRLAFLTYKGGGPELWGQQKPDGNFVRLYPFKSSQGGTISTPVWSPDGKRLAFVEGDRRGNTNIKVLDIGTHRVRQLTDKSRINTEPCWNPSGTQIVFTSDRDGSPQLYLMEDDGSNVRKLTQEGGYNASPAWSPDGSMIAYVSRFDSGFDLFVFKLLEGKAYQLTHGPGSSESPAWSPDGRFIVYTHNARGSSRLYSTDLSGNAPVQISELSPTQSPEWTRSR